VQQIQQQREDTDSLLSGNWRGALTAYEDAVANNPGHMGAMNDMAFIFANYMPGTTKGLDLAEWVAQETYRYTAPESAVMDTLGWSIFRHTNNAAKAEEYLRLAFRLIRPGDQFYISGAYHMMSVLCALGKRTEAETIFQTMSNCVPLNAIDKESYEAAVRLIQKDAIPTEEGVAP
jgi:hypothetical protein